MSDTKIEWADKVWNPVTGCTKVSQGCKNCYAERIAGRFWGERKFTDVICHEDRLDAPLHWKKPARVFVNSMSDLFHPDVPFEFVDRVWDAMAKNALRPNRHTFMILTKRPERMLEYFKQGKNRTGDHVPLLNVWLGVSVENQQAADERIPLLLQTPAAVRFVSCEPLLGLLDLTHDLDGYQGNNQYGPHLDWVICGGESGPGARPMHPDWARSLRDQCRAAGVSFFFKRMGAGENSRELDGQTWTQFPK